MESKVEIIALVLVIFMGLWRVYQFGVRWRKIHPKPIVQERSNQKLGEKQRNDAIIPLSSFNWRTTEPLKFRPFKPKYHLTMGLENCTPSELIEMDKNYLSHISLRREIMDSHTEIAMGATSSSIPAVNELYIYLTNKYLPQRYPTMFSLSGSNLINLVTSEEIPLVPTADPLETLRRLGGNIDEDFLLLLPSIDGDGYRLEAYISCFPAGFNTREKWGKKLREIHKPVPGYKEKLEKSMDRFFDKIEVGRLVRRVNWSITTHDRLFAASEDNHLYEGEEVAQEDVDISKTRLRCERQMLHRLPETRALCFSLKTYLYPVEDIKKEGLGETLAVAIDGLKEGSTPAMHFYKKGVVWGEAVKTFLRT
ncbi:hypothetical protein PVAG01_10998 [Phlyctema vagabunda]|uniref:HRQ family protein 2 n=1 Tax=Phlyctema vagabunda TaxID=108571 RepID=A0ABR4P3U3_9HELO